MKKLVDKVGGAVRTDRRGFYLGECAIGRQDPGATSAFRLIASLRDAAQEGW